ncbi:MAG: hypothetical protein H6Q36_971 [Chloroflexi bacterium]|nr:hypothetical protein [Chloroflexota bacterium]
MDVESPPRPTVMAVGERIERRFELVGGREQLSVELHRLATDLVGEVEDDELDPASRELLEREIDRAVAASIEPLIARFSAELARGFVRLPEDLQERLVRDEIRRELGLD